MWYRGPTGGTNGDATRRCISFYNVVVVSAIMGYGWWPELGALARLASDSHCRVFVGTSF